MFQYMCGLLQATVAAFAASEGQGHPRLVEIEKVSFMSKDWNIFT